LGCDAVCHHDGKDVTCSERIKYASENTFAHKQNACGQAYSMVQVECDICKGCSIEASGCTQLDVHVAKVSLPFDCQAGLANFAIGWSDPKKEWCCDHEKLGCSSHTPAVMHNDPHHPPYEATGGHYWKWMLYEGKYQWRLEMYHGSMPYDCDAGFKNWKAGWSQSKKSWCCQHIGKGCEV